ncbi:hypothetical protein BDQ17DRAFT_1435007 [Cyathus striatus]|nr:hypothetical protein BDQ17DRAFT_1435007 [Cyathus striatus]
MPSTVSPQISLLPRPTSAPAPSTPIIQFWSSAPHFNATMDNISPRTRGAISKPEARLLEFGSAGLRFSDIAKYWSLKWNCADDEGYYGEFRRAPKPKQPPKFAALTALSGLQFRYSWDYCTTSISLRTLLPYSQFQFGLRQARCTTMVLKDIRIYEEWI